MSFSFQKCRLKKPSILYWAVLLCNNIEAGDRHLAQTIEKWQLENLRATPALVSRCHLQRG
jgi:hypothetical protein